MATVQENTNDPDRHLITRDAIKELGEAETTAVEEEAGLPYETTKWWLEVLSDLGIVDKKDVGGHFLWEYVGDE